MVIGRGCGEHEVIQEKGKRSERTERKGGRRMSDFWIVVLITLGLLEMIFWVAAWKFSKKLWNLIKG